MRRIATIVIVGFYLLACTTSDPSVPLPTLEAAQDTVNVAERSYSIEVHVWRDFMPPVSLRGEPLIASVVVTAQGPQAFPAGLDADRIWVIDPEGHIWESKFSDESRPKRPANQLAKIARNGPRQDFVDVVDVVVRLVDDSGSRYYLETQGVTVRYSP